jgi:AraC-like DNA-binding protein
LRTLADDDGVAIYAELRPLHRDRSFIDHLFVLRDHGRLAGVGSNLFASPFSEIIVLGRYSDHDGRHGLDRLVWKAVHLPPRFGRQPRRRGFHGWMMGVRCRPLDLSGGEPALAGLMDLVRATVQSHTGESKLDPFIDVLDSWIENARPRLEVPISRQFRALEPEATRATRVTSLAAAAGVDPRTLQRHVRKRTGLGPKQYAAVQRFNAALQEVALGDNSLASIASDLGYADQSHLTTDLARQAGVPPGRFRAQARRLILPDAVRFFKDADLRSRVRLLVSNSGPADDVVTDVEIQSQGCKVRGPGPGELRTPGRDGDAGY